MRVCPACGAENTDEATQCDECAKPLGPLPPSPRPRSVDPVLPRPRLVPTESSGPVGGPAAAALRARAAAAARVSGPVTQQTPSQPLIMPAPPPAPPAPPSDLTPTPLPPIIAPPAEPSVTIISPGLPPAPVTGVPPLPEVPDGGLLPFARYAIDMVRARWTRRKAIQALTTEIHSQVAALDGVLGSLGQAARDKKLSLRVMDEENRAIDGAQHRRVHAERSVAEVEAKIDDENTKFEGIEQELVAKKAAAEEAAATAAAELEKLETERRAARERKKEVEQRQREYLKGADRREAQAAKAPLGDSRTALRSSAEDLRSDAARLQPEREELEARLAAQEAPLREATLRADNTRADRDAVRQALDGSRTGHSHRLAELEAERAHHAREAADAAAEIRRRLATLGTIANLNRVGDPDLEALYGRIDNLRAAISEREKEIDRMRAERTQYDRGALARGAAVIGGAVVLLIAAVSVLVAVL